MNKLIGSLLLFSLCFVACQKEVSFETGSGPSTGSLQSDVTGDCLPKTVSGIYEVNKALKPDSNYIQVEVDVLQTGSYVISTNTVNGMSFTASGFFITTGSNTVKLKGNGTPVTDGISNFVVTYDSTVCDIAVTVLPAGGAVDAEFTMDCAGADVFGSYVAGTPLTLSNYIEITVNVTTPGTYNIRTVASNDMVFVGSGSLGLGSQTIRLTGDVTTKPAAANAVGNPTNIPVQGGGGPNCSVQLMVTGAANYTIDCTPAAVTINGTYTERVALISGTNTIVIKANVIAVGSYTITGTINGMTFSASGDFAITGPNQNVTLTSSGTPAEGGTYSLQLTANGAAACSVSISVARVDYFPRTASSNWSYEFGGIANDSLLVIVPGSLAPKVVGTNSFTIFGETPDANLGFDTSNYYRKAGGNYYRWENLENYLGFDNEQFAEFIFTKDDQALGHKWTTAVFSGIITESGTPFNVSIRISFEIITKDGSVTVKGTTYPNTIVLKETYEVNINNTGWQDGTPIYGYYQDSYSRNVGWIMDQHFDENNVETQAARMEMRRFQVTP